MQDGSSLRSGEAGGDGDELAAQCRAAGEGMAVAGQGAGGAEQVVAARRADGPRTVGRELARWHVGQWPVDEIGEDGFDDRVPTVGDVGLRGRLGAVCEERMVSPDRE